MLHAGADIDIPSHVIILRTMLSGVFITTSQYKHCRRSRSGIWAEYSHPPMLKVSKKRYHVLFVSCPSPALDSIFLNMLPLLGGLLWSLEEAGDSRGDSSSIKSIDRLALTVLTWSGGRLGLASVVSYRGLSFDTRNGGVESDSLRAIGRTKSDAKIQNR